MKVIMFIILKPQWKIHKIHTISDICMFVCMYVYVNYIQIHIYIYIYIYIYITVSRSLLKIVVPYKSNLYKKIGIMKYGNCLSWCMEK